jgi:hypothetical protein
MPPHLRKARNKKWLKYFFMLLLAVVVGLNVWLGLSAMFAFG